MSLKQHTENHGGLLLDTETLPKGFPDRGATPIKLSAGNFEGLGVGPQEALGLRKTFSYIYDFGDDWRHRVKVEKTVTLDAPLSMALCLEGENACPPEDVGGAPSYAEFLNALADPKHPEHDDLKKWIGGAFDPAEFDVVEVNRRLNQTAT